jgi:hypothetical protein
MLELPGTILVPTPEEMSDRQDIEELLAKRKTAKIVEGFRIIANKTPQLPYIFSADINIDNSSLWDLFITLSDAFPAEVSVEYSLWNEELFISDHFPKKMILHELLPLNFELVRDATLIFGLLFHNKETLIELQVTESKYIRFWGSDKEFFFECMELFDLQEIKDIEFVDDYPKLTAPLRRFFPESRPPADVMWKLDRAFNPDSERQPA